MPRPTTTTVCISSGAEPSMAALRRTEISCEKSKIAQRVPGRLHLSLLRAGGYKHTGQGATITRVRTRYPGDKKTERTEEVRRGRLRQSGGLRVGGYLWPRYQWTGGAGIEPLDPATPACCWEGIRLERSCVRTLDKRIWGRSGTAAVSETTNPCHGCRTPTTRGVSYSLENTRPNFGFCFFCIAEKPSGIS